MPKNKCDTCANHNQTSMWCSLLKTKKTDEESCKGWTARTAAKNEVTTKSTAETKRLDVLVSWMRQRNVIALKCGTTAITLGSMLEPSQEAPPQDELAKLSPEEFAAKRKHENALLYYMGGLPARKVE